MLRSLAGSVVSRAGDAVVVSGCAGASSGALIRFARGGVGVIVSLHRGNSARVALVRGPAPARAESAIAESRAAALSHVGDAGAFSGRVVDALGAPLDGRGGLASRGADAPLIPGLRSLGPVARAPTGSRGALEWENAALDIFFPFARGSSAVLVGARGESKASYALTVARGASTSQASAWLPGIGVHVIWVSIGASLSAARARAGSLPEGATLVAATADGAAGAAALAPFAGIALGEAARTAGKHALVVIEGLGAAAAAARRVGDVSVGNDGAALMGGHRLSSLWDRASAVAGDAGGSLSILGLVDVDDERAGASEMDGAARVRASLLEAADAADQCIAVSADGSLDFPSFGARSGGRGGRAEAARGAARDAAAVVASLNAFARSHATAKPLGLSTEADTDVLVDALASTRALLALPAGVYAQGDGRAREHVENIAFRNLDAAFFTARDSRDARPRGMDGSSGGGLGGDIASPSTTATIVAARPRGTAATLRSAGGTAPVRRFSTLPHGSGGGGGGGSNNEDPEVAAFFAQLEDDDDDGSDAAKPQNREPGMETRARPLIDPHPFKGAGVAERSDESSDGDDGDEDGEEGAPHFQRPPFPHRRAFLVSFLIANGYSARVPAHRVREFEAMVFRIADAIPAPPRLEGSIFGEGAVTTRSFDDDSDEDGAQSLLSAACSAPESSVAAAATRASIEDVFRSVRAFVAERAVRRAAAAHKRSTVLSPAKPLTTGGFGKTSMWTALWGKREKKAPVEAAVTEVQQESAPMPDAPEEETLDELIERAEALVRARGVPLGDVSPQTLALHAVAIVCEIDFSEGM